MNLIEAIKSGKRFRRLVETPGFDSGYSCWYFIQGNSILTDQGSTISFKNTNSILSEDWEIEEEKIELTFEQVLNACEIYKKHFDYCHTEDKCIGLMFDLKQKLGFKE